MDQAWPRVSVGVPVHNGEKYLARALDSLAGSDYPALEVVICDNASTDRTREVALSYAVGDERFRYYRNDSNLGASENFNKAFLLSTGTYFRWLAHDDWCTTDYDSRCVQLMEHDRAIAVVFTAQNVVRDGALLKVTREGIAGGARGDPVARVRCLSWRLRDPTAPVFGLMRREILARTGLIRNAPEPDRLLMHEMALHGRLVMIDEPLFFHYRGSAHALHYGNNPKVRRRSFEWLHPENRNRRQLTSARVLNEHWCAIVGSDIGAARKVRCLWHVVTAALVRRPAAKLRGILKLRRMGLPL